MDAEIIARFGLIMQPSSWQPPSPALVQIKQLVREREALRREHLRESNHLKALVHGAICDSSGGSSGQAEDTLDRATLGGG
jgi:transposase